MLSLSLLIMGITVVVSIYIISLMFGKIGAGISNLIVEPKKRVESFTDEDRYRQFERIVDPKESDPYLIQSKKIMEEQTAEFEAQYREWERSQKK